MHPRQRVDAAFNRLDVVLDVTAARQPHDRLRQGQGILGAMIDFLREQRLALLRPLAFSDVDGHAAYANDPSSLVNGCGRGADAPTDLAIRPLDPKLRLIGLRA